MTVSEFDSYEGLLHSLRYRVLAGEVNEVHDENLKLLRPEKKTNYVTGKAGIGISRLHFRNVFGQLNLLVPRV